eukprot:TRINITY_DN6935_c0_g1_i1.p1 TRINITY_DN6935_c0_g1~~TRINITY_DN6935_c0_g1_i1.p1  ORF type:complete len:173 (-),score=0.93 TRINITY_DN6935_c0_g1_i1:58-576(-)
MTEEHSRCQKALELALTKSSLVKYLFESTEKLGCDITREFFKCMPCSKPVEGMYDTKLGLVVCENNTVRVEEVLLHEGIHAFDYCRAKLNPDNCVHVACSEIRAARLSGQCDITREYSRGNFKFSEQHQNCIRRRVALSLKSIPACQNKTKFAIDRAWDSCYNDLEPFGFIP